MSALHEGARFIAVGIAQVILDSFVFIALTSLGLSPAPANLGGRISGAAMGFWLNGKITFARHRQPRLGARFMRYAVLWLVMTAISTTALTVIARDAGLIHAWWSKPLVEAILGIVSFLVSRHWVYWREA
jgi:putative flippase GtrA